MLLQILKPKYDFDVSLALNFAAELKNCTFYYTTLPFPKTDNSKTLWNNTLYEKNFFRFLKAKRR